MREREIPQFPTRKSISLKKSVKSLLSPMFYQKKSYLILLFLVRVSYFIFSPYDFQTVKINSTSLFSVKMKTDVYDFDEIFDFANFSLVATCKRNDKSISLLTLTCTFHDYWHPYYLFHFKVELFCLSFFKKLQNKQIGSFVLHFAETKKGPPTTNSLLLLYCKFTFQPTSIHATLRVNHR